MSVIPMKSLLESGVHFGHRTHKWDPAMKPYIFTERNGIHIIDLQKTVKALEEAYNLVRDTVAENGTLLFVGTKRQAQETIQAEAERCNMPYVTQRWLGGMLTNWRTIRGRVNELEKMERMRDKGDFERITKKEALIMTREIERLDILLGGIRKLARLPDLLFVVDVRREETAIHEANLLKIPVVALVDTNCDPRDIDYVIPSNDDAIRAIKLLVAKMADAVLEGKAMRKDIEEEIELPVEVAMEGAEEVELTDEELLGAATLAKISSQRRPAVEEGEALSVEGEAPEVEGEALEVEGEILAVEDAAPAVEGEAVVLADSALEEDERSDWEEVVEAELEEEQEPEFVEDDVASVDETVEGEE